MADNFGSAFLYFKGSVIQDANKTKFGFIDVTIFIFSNAAVFTESKPLILRENEITNEVVQLQAFIHGLECAYTMNLNRVLYYSVGLNVNRYIRQQSKNKTLQVLQHLLPTCYKPNASPKPKKRKVAELVKRIILLKKRFQSCHSASSSSYVEIKNKVEAVLERARSRTSIISEQTTVIKKERCAICLEDFDLERMFEIGECGHRFCRDCVQKHAELRLQSMMIPVCPEFGCGVKLSIDDCNKFLRPNMYEKMHMLFKESQIPDAEKVYCPNPRCSNLISKAEALTISKNLEWTGRTELTACRCVKCRSLFCINCRVLWHSNITCEVYKFRELKSSSDDAMLNKLAETKKWRQCSRCSHMVELALGCNHIYCRCGHEFCYLCGLEWKNKKPTCFCPLWFEENIIL